MSPLWGSHLCIALRPDAIALVRFSCRNAKILEYHTAPCPYNDPNAGWAVALHTLSEILSKEPKWTGASVTIILSHHYVQYAVIPWTDNVRTHYERIELARLRFIDIFGEHNAYGDIRVSPGNPGMPWLACAINAQLKEELRVICKNSGSTLSSIQPFLMAAANYFYKNLSGTSFNLVVAELDRALLAIMHDGNWFEVRTLQISASVGVDLIRLIERSRILKGISSIDATIQLYAPECKNIQLPEGTPWRLNKLIPKNFDNTLSQGPLTMALTGSYRCA